MRRIESLITEYNQLGISQQLDYDKLYLYSIITHSTAIEGSTVSDIENQLLFDDGISPDRPIQEQLMNLDLKQAYERAFDIADSHHDITTDVLCELSGNVMKNTGSLYETIAGRFDSAQGELRLLNVSAGRGGKSYLAWQKIPTRLEEFCDWLNEHRRTLVLAGPGTEAVSGKDVVTSAEEIYRFSFEAHYRLVNIHPWADGNGRMSRLVMNMLQREAGVVPSIVKTEKRAEYIKSLAAAQAAEDVTPFIEFMTKHHEDNIAEQIREYKESLQGDELTRGFDTSSCIHIQDDSLTGEADKDGYTYGADTEAGGIKVKEPKRLSYLKLSTKELAVLNEVAEDPDITIEEIVVHNGFSRPTVTRAIRHLKELGIIERVGSKKTGCWKVETVLKVDTER